MTVLRSRRSRYSGLALLLGVGVVVALLVSPIGSARTQVAPVNQVAPAISQTLTTSTGTWNNTPTSFAYQWCRITPPSLSCADISGATTTSYSPGSVDAGKTLVARVTASNADGQAMANSAGTAVGLTVTGPANTSQPTITGTTTVASTLTANPGTWVGASVTFAYQWQRCDTSGVTCSAITGATNTTYVLATEDLGHTFRVAVTGTESSESHTVTSFPTGTVTAGAAPPPTGCPANKSAGPINVSEVSPPAHLVIDGQSSRPAVITSTSNTVVLRFHISACSGRSVIGALVYQTATPYQQFSESEQPTGPDGWATLTLHRLRFFPASPRQQLLVVFVRARKASEDLLGGISARRLVSFKVNLKS